MLRIALAHAARERTATLLLKACVRCLIDRIGVEHIALFSISSLPQCVADEFFRGVDKRMKLRWEELSDSKISAGQHIYGSEAGARAQRRFLEHSIRGWRDILARCDTGTSPDGLFSLPKVEDEFEGDW